jgi:hypothetical protein
MQHPHTQCYQHPLISFTIILEFPIKILRVGFISLSTPSESPTSFTFPNNSMIPKTTQQDWSVFLKLRPAAVSEEKSSQKLYQTLNEWKTHLYMFGVKLRISSVIKLLSCGHCFRKCFKFVYRNRSVAMETWHAVSPVHLHVLLGVGHFTTVVRVWRGPRLPKVWETLAHFWDEGDWPGQSQRFSNCGGRPLWGAGCLYEQYIYLERNMGAR